MGAPANRKGLTRFVPGVSGNPSGRPAGVRAFLKAKYGKSGEKLFEFLHEVMEGTITAQEWRPAEGGPVPIVVVPTVRERVHAAELLLAYHSGKPTAAVELSGPDGGPIPVEATSRRLDPGAHTDAELERAESSLAALAELRAKERAALPAGDVLEGEVVEDGPEED